MCIRDRVYTDYKELAADPELDAVAIVTPDFAHADIACAMADAGKDILIEKPLATTREDIDRICEAVERNGCLLYTSSMPKRVSVTSQEHAHV